MTPSGDMVRVQGGTFLMGSDRHYAEEAPMHQVRVDGFWIDRCTVTNEDFARFVRETGHVTVAELTPTTVDYPGAVPELLVPASIVFQKPAHRVDLANHYNWWALVPGADWRHPEGPGSSIEGRARHPVVHVAYDDVEAYAAWAGKAVPSEAEWEYAARGGLDGATYAWGDCFAPGGRLMANTWQGEFPIENRLVDGFEGTAPVGSFPPNGYDLLDMIGNVWEWTSDWYRPGHPREEAVNPRGPEPQDIPLARGQSPSRVVKGGSYLCASNYCARYRPAARQPQEVDLGAAHIGFRTVLNRSGGTKP